MPTYSYACTECSNRFDVVQAFTDDALTTCEECNGRLRKIFGKVGVVFKGSGFYRTDSRDAGKTSSNGSSSAKATSTDSGSGGSGDGGTKASSDGGAKSADKPKADAASTPAAASA
ncbi:FmdB family transcriptional regulator [Mycolicibacter terrae]|uniref:FmdB family transcriptional regulator n=2 Tax=Mycolicibacter TaxID=1073531 RepID=A0A1A2XS28_MYCSD|nr:MULTISPECIES: FmdB family zinc ribbon protein [Mycolicibacter]OBH21213.1 FmdB family transcriptional regulator [Mycolicibacter sinensis]OBI28545.1 FmdB family transcriptional regulator [Mycolicibacter sinensis]RRR40906.1 FmdB family transcriptional regulator [Mycolicibacter terrae]